MLKHQIIVHKETYPVVQQHDYSYRPPHQQHSMWPYKRNVTKQEELDRLLETDGFSCNDFLVMGPTQARDLASIHRIVQVQTDWTKLIFSARNGRAMPYRILKLANNVDNENCTWLRWDEAENYRHPTAVERDTLILPNIDYIQDYCKRKLELIP